VKPKKLRFYKVNSVGPETYDDWEACPTKNVNYSISRDLGPFTRKNHFTWRALENGVRRFGRCITKADATTICQKRWDAFVAKQVKAMMEKA